MIVVKLMGGLGNQMFQYAFAKILSLKNKTNLKLDLSCLLDRTPRENFVFRNFELEIFNLKPDIIAIDDLQNFRTNTGKSLKEKIAYKFLGKKTCILNEKSLKFSSEYFIKNKDVLITGYWQSENYFNEYEIEIRKDFIFNIEPNPYYKKLIETAFEKNSVSLHIRRGDYANIKLINELNGLCDKEYYINAISYFENTISNPYFFIISDEIEWAKKEFKKIQNVHFVENNAGKDFEDLRLMSLCKHNIIANSTFSWWGAWLNNNPNKIIIAPKKWFSDSEMQKQIEYLIPEKWLKF